MKEGRFLKTGEFAKLCNTTKETLFYYDKEGILKPRYVSENGYRFYDIAQRLDFDIITMLKETGSSIKEILLLLQSNNYDFFIQTIKNKQKFIDNEINKLVMIKDLIKDMISCLKDISSIKYDTLIESYDREELYGLFPIIRSKYISSKEFVDSYINYMAVNTEIRPPIGSIVNRQDAEKLLYIESYFPKKYVAGKDELYIKKAGVYATLFHSGTRESHLASYKFFVNDIIDKYGSINDNILVFDMMKYNINNEQKNNYTYKYTIFIK